ncbi:MAG: DUF4149 domain-containing protein [Pyrinomonadaceae bacterium]|nr:DUF4149 domain-containing protein [Pyrinomonadaceae bacterium]
MSIGIKEQSTRVRALREQHARTRHSALTTVLGNVRLLLIAIWLGAAVFFSFAVAPSAFDVLPTRDLAGAVVGRTLAIVNVGGFIVSLLMLMSAPVARVATGKRAFVVEVSVLAVLAISTAVNYWIITRRIEGVRRMMNRPIEEVALGDPLRIAFSNLHLFSVVLLTTGIVAAAVALLLVARRTYRRSS